MTAIDQPETNLEPDANPALDRVRAMFQAAGVELNLIDVSDQLRPSEETAP